MMKNIILLVGWVLVASNLSAQTFEMEVKYLTEQLNNGDLLTDVAKDRNKELQDINREGIYPNIEFDTLTLQLGLKKIYSFPGMTKVEIFNRISQWCALVNNDREAVMKHTSMEDGKIILRGYCEIPYKRKLEGLFGFFKFTSDTKTNCWMTIVLTIIDEKVKTEFMGMKYVFREAHTSPQSTETVSEVNMNDLFPVAQFDKGKIRTIVNLLNSTISRINLMHLSMVKYVKDKDADYKF